MIAFDTVCNAMFITIGLVTDPVIGNWITLAVILHGLGISAVLSDVRPFASRFAHFVCVQIPAFCTVYGWCKCCNPLG